MVYFRIQAFLLHGLDLSLSLPIISKLWLIITLSILYIADDLPMPVVDEVAPANIEMKQESKVPSHESVVEKVVPASVPAKETEFKAPSVKQV